MRKLALLVCVVSVAGLLLAQVTPVLAAAKTHDMKATVVSVNIEEKLLTIKNEKGEEKTAPVLDTAVKDLKTLKAGDAIMLTCQDDEQGAHKGISKIKAAAKS